MKNNHSVSWNIVKMLSKKVKFHRTLNVILLTTLLSVFLAVLFCFLGGK